MAKRKIAALILCVVGLNSLVLTSVHAQQPLIVADGCALLGELVTNQLTLKRWYGDGGSGLLLSNPGQIDITICNQTARTVTVAFTAALAEMNIGITWDPYRRIPDVPCHSGDISQCHPERYPFPGGAGGDHVFILESWRAVQQAVASNMPFGVASDTARFSASKFGTTFSRSLEQNVSETSIESWRTILSP